MSYCAISGVVDGQQVEYHIGGEHDGWLVKPSSPRTAENPNPVVTRWRPATAEEAEGAKRSMWPTA